MNSVIANAIKGHESEPLNTRATSLSRQCLEIGTRAGCRQPSVQPSFSYTLSRFHVCQFHSHVNILCILWNFGRNSCSCSWRHGREPARRIRLSCKSSYLPVSPSSPTNEKVPHACSGTLQLFRNTEWTWVGVCLLKIYFWIGSTLCRRSPTRARNAK